MIEIAPRKSLPESIIGLVLDYFYDGGEPIKTEGIFDLLSVERPWLTLQQVRSTVSDIMKRSPDTLSRGSGSARAGYFYTYTGIRYKETVVRSEKATIADKEARREAEKPLRAKLISKAW